MKYNWLLIFEKGLMSRTCKELPKRNGKQSKDKQYPFKKDKNFEQTRLPRQINGQ